MSAATIALVERVGALAAAHEALAPGLRAAERLADELDAGAALPQAFAGMLGQHHAQLLAGPRPPLAQSALLVSQELRLARERRHLMHEALAYPVVSLLTLLTLAMVLRGNGLADAAAAWLWACLPAAVLVLLAMLPTPRILQRVTLGAWRGDARRAERYARAALAARWRLDEQELTRLFGSELDQHRAQLAVPDAERQLVRLAEHYRERARRSARWQARLLAVGVLACAGAVALALGHTLWTGMLDRLPMLH